jgi:Yip1 domain
MDPSDTNEINTQLGSTEPETPNGEELSHSDKMIGVFTEPGKTFTEIAKFPPRNKDWVIPILILFLLVGLIQRISMMNEEVYFEIKQQQSEPIEQQVEEGSITREQADQQLEAIDTFMLGPISWVTTIAGSLIGGFIIFFIIVTFYFLFIKFLLKGDGNYSSALVANGLTAYITIVLVIVAGILTLLFGTLVKDTSLATLLGSDRSTITGWIFAKIDPISIWAYIVLSIGYAKMFKSESTGKYYALVFGIWIIVGLILFFVAQSVPFLKNFM